MSWIDEFTTVRDKLKKDMSFTSDRTSFGQIKFEYGSMMVNLAYYWRIICAVLVIHLALKLISLLNKRRSKNAFFVGIWFVKNEIYKSFYIRYLIEIAMFLWIGTIVEFVSTNREWTLQQLSLAFDICLLIFLVVFTFAFVFALVTKKTKETMRSFDVSFFLVKKALWAICI